MKNNLAKRIGLSLLIPGATLIVLLILCAAKGISLFGNSVSWPLFFRAVATVTLTTFALSINLDTGRFDFSLGSVSMMSGVVAGTCAVQWGLGPWPALAIAVLVGTAMGFLHGCVYVITRIPPIIVSLGMTLLYEGIAYVFTDGKGVTVVTRSDLLAFASIPNYVLLTAAGVAVIIVLFDYTKFGANYRALLSGQKIAVDTGIREVPNALGCYAVTGALMGIVGFISLTNTGNVQMSLSFGSIGIMFTAFLPMFIGGWVGRQVNRRIGMMLGAVTMALVSLGYARLDTSSSVQSIISAMMLVLFLIYLNNETTILSVFHKKQK